MVRLRASGERAVPELPEVETVCRGLRARLCGWRIEAVTTRRPDLRVPLPTGLSAKLTGARVADVRRRAKYGIIELEKAPAILFHLGMSGRFLLEPPPFPAPGPHDHVAFELASRKGERIRLTLRDPRRFGLLDLLPDAGAHPRLRGLGPEPLTIAGPALRATLRGRKCAIKTALLDQRILAGVGNIYACEALFRAGISPRRRAGTIGPRRAAALAAALREVLEEAIRAGGSTLRDHVQIGGDEGWFQLRLQVYGRAGDACPACGGPVRQFRQAGRSTFHCPACQR